MSMTLRPELEGMLATFAKKSGESIDTVLEIAVRQYIEQNTVTEEQDDKMDREINAYIKMHSTLWTQYPYHYVAVHEGQLVDVDQDRSALRRQIREKYGQTVILLRQVEEEPDPIINLRGRRVDKNQ